MVFYVKGKDKFWHWCKNCEDYPEEITETTSQEPVNNLCPKCYQNSDCEKVTGSNPSDGPAIGFIERKKYRR